MFVEAEITVSKESGELLVADLFDLGASGIEEKENSIICFFENTSKSSVEIKLKELDGNYPISLREKENENWMENWKENFKAVFIGEKFVIKPTWETIDTDRIVIEIDPKMAFGTGTHETTQLILEYMADYLKGAKTLLDVGTGSGILAIAAEKLGLEDVYGIDYDPIAIENALENAELNNTRKTKLETAVITDTSGEYDCALANINRHILLDINQELIARVKKGGYLLLSGLLNTDREDIKTAYNSCELVLEKIKGEWALLVFKI